MHLRTTNIPPPTFDVRGFSFGSAGALVFKRILRVCRPTGSLYCLRRSQARMVPLIILALPEVSDEPFR